MGLKGILLKATVPLWIVVVVGGVVSVYTGRAEPYLSPSDVPGGPAAAFVGMLVLLGVGLVVVDSLQERLEVGKWRTAGRQAGLQPAGGGGFATPPDLTGTADGRTVTARVVERKIGNGGEGGSSGRIPFTLVETALDGDADEGAIAGGEWGRIEARIGTVEFEAMVEHVDAAEELTVVEAGDLSVVGTSEATARAVATGPAEEALRSLGKLNLVYVGDASRAVASFTEARNEEMEGIGSSFAEYPVDNLVERVPADAATVTIETPVMIRDGDELRRHAEAVVAIADAFEEATARTPSPG